MAKKATPDEPHEDELRAVVLPSGGIFSVYDREQGYFQERVKRYLADSKFKHSSDLATLDQILMMELLVWRLGTWLSQEKDYWGDTVDQVNSARTMKELSGELRQLKGSLGIDKVTRDKQRGEESVSTYLANLRVRAREFGVMREEQLARGLELCQEAIALIGLHDRCDAIEREELKVRDVDVLQWLRESFAPRFQEIDAHFRTSQQRLWIRDQ